jgi:ATP-dependent NAD(P)H-hydrate dehydratase
MQLAARIAIKLARENELYVVIDADGLFLVQNDPSVVKGYKRAVLTPNVVEFQRLAEKLVRCISCVASPLLKSN